MRLELVVNDDNKPSIVLKKDGSPLLMDSNYTVKAAVIDKETEYVVGPVACSVNETGANWSQGIVVAHFTAAQSANLIPGDAIIEIEVTYPSGDRETYFFRHAVVTKSYIDNV